MGQGSALGFLRSSEPVLKGINYGLNVCWGFVLAAQTQRPLSEAARPARVRMLVGEGSLTCLATARLCQQLQGNWGPMPISHLI